MKKKITKKNISISIDNSMNEIVENMFENKSKYIEWLIYKDLKNYNLEGIKRIII